jgi:hypothetical protein
VKASWYKAVRLWTLKDSASRSGAGTYRAFTFESGYENASQKRLWMWYLLTFKQTRAKAGQQSMNVLLEKFDEGQVRFLGQTLKKFAS